MHFGQRRQHGHSNHGPCGFSWSPAGGGVVGCATEDIGRGQLTEARTLEFIP